MRRRWVLAGASTALVVLMLDSTATVLALPSIRLALGASASGIQWAQNVYLLALAALVVTLGRLGDALGRRQVLVAGLVVFAGGSVICATAGSIAAVVAGRAIQGVGAAAMLAPSLALAAPAFTGERRARAVGAWAAALAVALAIGPLVGGVVVEVAGWRWLFWLNLPLAALSVALVAFATGEPSRQTTGRRVDVAGLALLGAGLTLVVLALVQGEAWGWGSIDTLAPLLGGLALLGGFLAIEGRAREPIVDLSRFRDGPRLGASAAAFALVGSYWTVMFLLPQYLDLGLRFSAARVGLLMLPLTVPIAVLSPLASRLGTRLAMSAGMACATVGVLTLTRLDGSSNYWDVAPGLVLLGVGLAAVVATLPSEKPSIASGAPTMTGWVGGAVLLAATGAVFQHVDVAQRASGASFEGAFAAGIADAAWLLTAVLAVATALAWLLLRPTPEASRPHVRLSRL